MNFIRRQFKYEQDLAFFKKNGGLFNSCIIKKIGHV